MQTSLINKPEGYLPMHPQDAVVLLQDPAWLLFLLQNQYKYRAQRPVKNNVLQSIPVRFPVDHTLFSQQTKELSVSFVCRFKTIYTQ